MAKKKTEVEEQQLKMTPDDILDAIEKKYGQGLYRSGKEIAEENPEIITVSPSIDLALGGGIPEGSWVSIVGPEKLGKTVTVLSFCAAAQKQGRRIYYFDVECRLKPRDLMGIEGLKTDMNNFVYIRSTKDNFLSSLEILGMAEEILKSDERCVVVFDSVSAMINGKLIDESLDKADFGGGYKVVSRFLDECAPVVRLNKSIVVGIIHQYANTSGYGAAKNEKVANRWKYQADVKLVGRKSEGWRIGSETKGPEIGKIITWAVGTSAIGAPGSMPESYLRYGVGLDKTYEIIQIGIELGIIKKAGAWLEFMCFQDSDLKGTEFENKPPKVQGSDKAYEFIKNNPKLFNILNKKVNDECLGS